MHDFFIENASFMNVAPYYELSYIYFTYYVITLTQNFL